MGLKWEQLLPDQLRYLLTWVLAGTYLASWVGIGSGLLAREGGGPCALVLSPDGTQAYVGCSGCNRVVAVDLESGKVRRCFQDKGSPLGLALDAKGSQLYVVDGAASSSVSSVDLGTGQEGWRVAVGHSAAAPVLSRDGKRLYVCNRFNNDISVISLAEGRETHRIPVAREPVAAALSPDDSLLVVANHLHRGRGDAQLVSAEVSVIDTGTLRVVRNVQLPNGSGLLRGVAVSPDGRYAAVTHILARYYLPTVEADRGWINNNALSLLDLTRLECLGTVVLDDLDLGAANPWGVVWTSQSTHLLVSHAGTHEISVIDAPKLLEKMRNRAQHSTPLAMANDPLFLQGLRRRISVGGEGPRALAASGDRVVVANYFSDDLTVLDLSKPAAPVRIIPLGGHAKPSSAAKGEALFNDARICYQSWQSCASCHSSDARTDGLNWDLLNDGVGNPKNTKSLVLSSRTPPSMSQGVRTDFKAAVRAGLQHILFRPANEATAQLIDAYLESLNAMPSPLLKAGSLSSSARRGRDLFLSSRTGCAGCHPEGLYTDLQSHDVGTASSSDTTAAFDTPTLVELWRTAPYLHDGSAATLREVITSRTTTMGT